MSSVLGRKKILLAITGGIAAYKSAHLCRDLKKLGAEVRVVMTAGAQEFITPLTLQALSGNAVHTDLLDPQAELGMGHIELAKWPDLIIVAPATANLIAKYSQGMADDLLTTILLATTAPVFLAPAMNQAMWLNKLTQRNVSSLRDCLKENIEVIGPAEGEQACGDNGPGRMVEPDVIVESVEKSLAQAANDSLNGCRVVITAGPTREALDPVRYITNHSSGKMGYALAESFADQGADVVLISGPVAMTSSSRIKNVPVISAKEMFAEVDRALSETETHIFVACAAVADYAPVNVAEQKMKKKAGEGDVMTLTLSQNPDIVASVSARPDRPYTVGFAAETNDVLTYARSKLQKKKLDMIIANDVSKPSIGFNSDFNEVHIITEDEEIPLQQQSKTTLSQKLVEIIEMHYQKVCR